MSDCLQNEDSIVSDLSLSNTDSLTGTLDSGDNINSDVSIGDAMVSSISDGDSTDSNLGDDGSLYSELVIGGGGGVKYTGQETDSVVVTVDNNVYTISASLKPIKFDSVDDFPKTGSEKLIYIDFSNKALYGWNSKKGVYYKLVADVKVPTKLSEFENDAGFITNTVNNLVEYYKKTETYTQEEIDDKLANLDVDVDFSDYYNKTETDTLTSQALNLAKSYTDAKVAGLIDSAPETLDTFKEIADAFAEDQQVLDALNGAIGNKADKNNPAIKFLEEQYSNRKNLLDITKFINGTDTTATVDEDFLTITGKWYIYYLVNLEANVDYTLSYAGSLFKTPILFDKNLNTNITNWNNNGSIRVNTTDTYALVFYVSNGTESTVTIANVQIEVGATVTRYEPYAGNIVYTNTIQKQVSYVEDVKIDYNYDTDKLNLYIKRSSGSASETDIPYVTEYIKKATVSNNLLILTNQDDENVTFGGGGGSKVIWEVWE